MNTEEGKPYISGHESLIAALQGTGKEQQMLAAKNHDEPMAGHSSTLSSPAPPVRGDGSATENKVHCTAGTTPLLSI